jgi:hypothetical protein
MATKRKQNPDEIVHAQVKPGETVLYEGHAYGDRSTLQLRRRDLAQVAGRYDEVKPGEVPDAAER